MINKIKFVNNASVRITKALNPEDTTIEVAEGDADFFPRLQAADEYFILTLLDGEGNFEIVKCTSRTSAAFAVERAQEGTTAKAFKKGSILENRLTAGSITQVFQQALATETEHGVARLATEAEVSAGATAGNGPAVITPEAIKPSLLNIKQNAFIAGGIIAFSGQFIGNNPVPLGSSTPDTNWHICNGQNGTPDLRERFIMGCNAVSNIGQTGGYNKMFGRTGPATLTISQMPAHTHKTYPTFERKPFATGVTAAEPWEGHRSGFEESIPTGGNQPHVHYFDGSYDNRPQFMTLAYIMKIR